MKKLTSLFITFALTASLIQAQESMPAVTFAQESINSFDTKLFKTLSATESNVNYSAISIYSLLYALQKGSDGDTKNQIKQVIDLKPNEETDFLVRYIIKSTKNMTNSLWYKKSLGIQSDYRLFTKDYDFIIKPVDFYQGAKVRKEINSFISKQTNKLIDNFLAEDLPSSTQLVLLNTLYFNQKWKSEFDEKDTYEQLFHKNSREERKINMMHKTTSLQYYEDKDFQIAEFDYQDDRYSMIVFLPYDYDYNFQEADLVKELEMFNEEKKRSHVEISFPKFDLTSKYNLVPILQAMGMTDAFDPKASNLSKIFTDDSNLFVDTAIHQVRITVNEKETKAAAVTMFGMKATAFMPQRPPIVFNADHPFAYVILDKSTGINLFTGIVREPR